MGAKKKPESAKMNVQVGVMITKNKKSEYEAKAEKLEKTYSEWVRESLEKSLAE